MGTENLVERAADLLWQATCAVALTGAGISTPSGIPDFRSPESGLWERVNVMEVASIEGFRRNPDAFYEWIRPLARVLLEAEPNPAHNALAQLEEHGCLKAVITQNIDGLHQLAGSHKVFELHGHLRELVCPDCGRVVPTSEVQETVVSSGAVPRCEACDAAMKPAAVLYGEELPLEAVAGAMELVGQADLMLVAGSSLTVTPVSELPRMILSRGGSLIVVNLTPTYADAEADVVLHQDVADVLPRILEAYRNGLVD